ncbi:Nitroreductase [Novosphingobium sp. CF614]|uniref:nitroreductase family protein n=1 Tax=Novosphingobium sp. CF614 TaxID=1884364 RepID=UPI0008F204D0|nr:nitroreductase [Novosphingobium sp. CF614]SFF77618.1 Nitroreductase [Novosphingobium sp. CF614]
MIELFQGSSPETLDLLHRRRSTSAKAMGEPGPDAGQLRQILQAASRVPDHGKLFPWRFLVIEGDARAKLGEVLEEALVVRNAGVGESLKRFERNRFLRAPVIVTVISSLKTEKPIPEWEQRLSAGAVCQTVLVAAAAAGFGANWLTEWCAYDELVTEKLGLAEGEKIAGFIYIGTGTAPLEERPRPVLDEIVEHWTGSN